MSWMFLPIVACLLMALALGWFGLHVLEREVIFVDLALAQIAALGTTYAVFMGHEPDEPVAYVLGLVFTIIGAVVFSLARRFQDRVPQEALIGVAYVVCAAGGAVLLDFAADPHGAEKLQHLLVGNVIWIRPSEVWTIAAACAGVGLVHWFARGPLLDVTFRPDEAAAKGLRLWVWDLLFYVTFGVVITSLVHVGGVLLIFSYLIIPAVIARLFVDGIGARLGVAYSVAIPISVIGIASSYEHAAGPLIVVMLGSALLACLIFIGVRRAESPGTAAVGVAVTLVALGAFLFSFHSSHAEHDHDEAVHHAHAPASPVHDDLPAGAGPATRERWYRNHLEQPAALRLAAANERDASLRLLLGVGLARAGDPRGIEILADVAAGDVPFLRMEADDRLRVLAGDTAPQGDPLSGPVTGWSRWSPPLGWHEHAMLLEVP